MPTASFGFLYFITAMVGLVSSTVLLWLAGSVDGWSQWLIRFIGIGSLGTLLFFAPFAFQSLRQKELMAWAHLNAWLSSRLSGKRWPIPEVPKPIQAQLRLVDETLSLQAERIAEFDLIDSETGVMSRLGFMRRVQDEFDRADRFKRALSVVFFDLDGKVDHALLSPLLRTYGRTVDLVARVAQNRFALVLPETALSGADELGRRIKSEIEMNFDVSVGVGVACYPSNAHSAEQLVSKAEKEANSGLDSEPMMNTDSRSS